MTVTDAPAGALLREWRVRRRRSQLDLAVGAEVSARHISFLETGRARPSRAMIERLCDELDVPLRARNDLYLAAGFAPVHRESSLASQDLAAASRAVDLVLAGHEPFPALAVDGRWDLVAANTAAQGFLDAAAPALLEPPVNVLRLTLHPDGMAGRIRNLPEWSLHTLRRVRRRLERTGDPALRELLTELTVYAPAAARGAASTAGSPVRDAVVPLQVAGEHGDLAFCYTTTVFGSPQDVTLDEIAVESFFPADDATAAALGVTRRPGSAGR
ncbi:helix-turn-helix domain-containing protein [Cellulosimicrobium sp. Marseille-Q8652]